MVLPLEPTWSTKLCLAMSAECRWAAFASAELFFSSGQPALTRSAFVSLKTPARSDPADGAADAEAAEVADNTVVAAVTVRTVARYLEMRILFRSHLVGVQVMSSPNGASRAPIRLI
ncbi:hypothetical protein [Streptomyces sp. NBC_00467]|uniref:hypothetical protein n=1 Tax=Streptomyces sp. NBC_00467 TaxID=2975752 RepID=UPI002E1869EA